MKLSQHSTLTVKLPSHPMRVRELKHQRDDVAAFGLRRTPCGCITGYDPSLPNPRHPLKGVPQTPLSLLSLQRKIEPARAPCVAGSICFQPVVFTLPPSSHRYTSGSAPARTASPGIPGCGHCRPLRNRWRRSASLRGATCRFAAITPLHFS